MKAPEKPVKTYISPRVEESLRNYIKRLESFFKAQEQAKIEKKKMQDY